jgi:hypothetical protein
LKRRANGVSSSIRKAVSALTAAELFSLRPRDFRRWRSKAVRQFPGQKSDPSNLDGTGQPRSARQQKSFLGGKLEKEKSSVLSFGANPVSYVHFVTVGELAIYVPPVFVPHPGN